MMARHTATLTAVLLLGFAGVVQAQQSTDTLQATDSLKHARHHDEKMVTSDTVKLHRDVALRDSLRTVLERDQAQGTADGKRIDSLKAVLDKERKATPRDSAAINRNLATLNRLRATHDRELDKTKREKQRVDFEDKQVKRESNASIGAHHDLRADRPATAKKVSSRKS